jgi:hypothetical protein
MSGGTDGRHVRKIAAVADHALSRRDQLYRRSGFAGAGGAWGLAVFLRKAESNLCSAVCFLGASRELKIILGGSSGAECSQRGLACAGVR